MEATKQTRGGSGRGQDRKPLKAGTETVVVSIKMTDEQRGKLQRLGGSSWVRARIDKARDPGTEGKS